jgi:hypothetical protein
MATPPAISFVEGRPDRDIHRDLLNLRGYIYGIDNDVWLAPASGSGSGTLSAVQTHDAWSIADGSSTGPSFSTYLPRWWVGQRAHITWYVSEASTDAGNFRVNTRVLVLSELSGATLPGTADLDESVTTAAGAANTPLALTTSSFAVDGRFFSVRFQRIGADAADTATVALILWGGLLVRE